MSDQTPTLYQLADQFINLANELAQNDGSPAIGTALRYAAARYNTFEATLGSHDLSTDKEKLMDMFCEDFRKMLAENIDDYAQRLSQAKDANTDTAPTQ
ncbi:MAG: DUF3144 domain-containing protein [Gammaproteobacteria bacterium]|nr:DUF3144 domain-containing protein [Gammaproteobacteria bacterium]